MTADSSSGAPEVRLFNAELLDALSDAARANPRRRQNHNLHASHAEPVQRFFNAIEPDSYVRPHRHLTPGSEETLILIRGALGFILFDEYGNPTQTYRLTPSDANIGLHLPLSVWHSAIALEPGTIFFETKCGPYTPLTKEEQAPWAPEENTLAAKGYLEQMRKLFNTTDKNLAHILWP